MDETSDKKPHEELPLWRRFFAWLWMTAWAGAAAGLAAVALLYFVLFWKLSFLDMQGNECGSDDCPRGMGWLMLFTPLLAFAARVLWSALRDARRSVPAWTAVTVLALAAVWPGWAAYEWMRGPQLDVSGWQEPVRPSAPTVGAWLPAGPDAPRVVRARADGLVAYDGEGRKGWRLPAAEGAPVCALSRTTAAGTGLVVRGDGRRCGVRVEAVDLAEGRRLWAREQAPAALGGPAAQAVAVAGTTAVVAEERALVGLDLRGGAERWRVAVPAGCAVRAVDGDADGDGDGDGVRALYVEQCTDSAGAAGARLSAVDARTGAPAWQVPLPDTGAGGEAGFVAVRPLAVRVTGAVLLFDDDGRRRGSVPDAGPMEDLLPEPLPVVAGGLLVTPVKDGDTVGVSAYSLTDGRRVWHSGFGDGGSVLGLAIGEGGPGGQVDVVSRRHGWTYLTHLDGRSGRRGEEPAVLRDLPLGSRFVFRPGPPGSYVFVNLVDDDGTRPPVFDIDPVRGW